MSGHASIALDSYTIAAASGSLNPKMLVIMDMRQSKWKVMETQLKEARNKSIQHWTRRKKNDAFQGVQAQTGAYLDDVEIVDLRV